MQAREYENGCANVRRGALPGIIGSR
jgi:hypothetical protein